MQRDETVALPAVPTYVPEIWSVLERLAANKKVLNVGAAGNVEYYLAGKREMWMHERLRSVARELRGLDIDEESVAYANRHGEDIVLGNCETVQLGTEFDLVVLSEVLEHVNAPAAALRNLADHLSPGGKLFVTTPNPTYFGTLLRAVSGRSLGIYYDHVLTFFPENLTALCQRLDLKVSAIHFYNTVDTRSGVLRAKSWIAKTAARIVPRLAGHFILILEAG